MEEKQELDTMNVALPRALKEFVQDEVARSGYSSASEYVRELIRAARKKLAAEELEGLLRKGLDSGPAETMTAGDWQGLRQEALARFSEAEEQD